MRDFLPNKEFAAIMQPTFLPWIGDFDLIDFVDRYLFLDNVQLVKRSWDTRNRIKTANGELYLTVPVKKTAKRDNLFFNSAFLDFSLNWREKFLKSVELAYKKAPFFEEVFLFFKELLFAKFDVLSEFNMNIIVSVAKKIGIDTQFFKVSDLGEIDGKKDVLLCNILEKTGVGYYISPQGSANYINKEVLGGEFAKRGIELFYRDFEHPKYPQLWGDFLPFMSIFDLLFNVGFENALNVIKRGRKKPIYYKNFGG